MKLSFLSLYTILLIANFASAQISTKDSLEEHTGIVYGDGHAFSVTAPKGWVLDNSSGVSQGLHAVFYPEGGSWENSTTVMYVNTALKEAKGNETIENLISYDSLNFLQDFDNGEIKNLPNLITGDNKEAKVLGFKYSNFELVAYIDEPKIVSLIIMTSRNQEDYEKSLDAFNELVESYYFITSDVEFNK